MMLDRKRHERVRSDGYCWGQDSGAWSCASPKYVLECSQTWEFMSSGAPGCSVAMCQVGRLLTFRDGSSPNGQGARRTDGVATEKSTPPFRDPQSPDGKTGAIKRCGLLDLLFGSTDLLFHPRASRNSEPMRAVSSQLQLCVRRSKRIRLGP